MSELQNELTEQQREKREELFRYTDRSHPMIEELFKLNDESSQSDNVLQG